MCLSIDNIVGTGREVETLLVFALCRQESEVEELQNDARTFSRQPQASYLVYTRLGPLDTSVALLKQPVNDVTLGGTGSGHLVFVIWDTRYFALRQGIAWHITLSGIANFSCENMSCINGRIQPGREKGEE